jgi:hypothetical protein
MSVDVQRSIVADHLADERRASTDRGHGTVSAPGEQFSYSVKAALRSACPRYGAGRFADSHLSYRLWSTSSQCCLHRPLRNKQCRGVVIRPRSRNCIRSSLDVPPVSRRCDCSRKRHVGAPWRCCWRIEVPLICYCRTWIFGGHPPARAPRCTCCCRWADSMLRRRPEPGGSWGDHTGVRQLPPRG